MSNGINRQLVMWDIYANVELVSFIKKLFQKV